MKRIGLVLLITAAALVILYASTTCAQEKRLITTYPSPYGVYKELTTTENTSLATKSGSVVIGTENPNTLLDIKSTGTPTLTVQTSATSNQDAIISIKGARPISPTADVVQIKFYNNTSKGAFQMGEISTRNADSSSETGNSDLLFKVNNGGTDLIEAMRIDDSGNVGIGTSAPSQRLSIGEPEGGKLILTREDANVVNGEVLGRVMFDATDGSVSTVDASAMIEAVASQDQDILNKGADLVFYTKPSGGDSNEAAVERMRIKNRGSIGIGTDTPNALLHVVNPIIAILGESALVGVKGTGETGVCGVGKGTGPAILGQAEGGGHAASFSGTVEVMGTTVHPDLSEIFPTSGKVDLGDVVIMDTSGNAKVRKSYKAYDKTAVGIISEQPSQTIEGKDTQELPETEKAPIAMVGRVRVNACTENGPIEMGDLLTTSSTPGHAMRTSEYKPGTIVGKALEPLKEGKGKILVLVCLM